MIKESYGIIRRITKCGKRQGGREMIMRRAENQGKIIKGE